MQYETKKINIQRQLRNLSRMGVYKKFQNSKTAKNSRMYRQLLNICGNLKLFIKSLNSKTADKQFQSSHAVKLCNTEVLQKVIEIRKQLIKCYKVEAAIKEFQNSNAVLILIDHSRMGFRKSSSIL